MHVALINMPWASIDVPPLSLGLLSSVVAKALPDVAVTTNHANLTWAEWVAERVVDFDYEQYKFFSLDSYFEGFGDWVFASALNDPHGWRIDEFRALAETKGMDASMAERLHRLSPEFIEQLADEVVATCPNVVGMTSTFQQNAACLALAAALKRRDRSIITMMGGANCDAEQGAALHRNFSAIDFVVRGEGEAVLPALLSAITFGDRVQVIPGVCWRDRGSSVANSMASATISPTEYLPPNYDSYFERVAASSIADWFEPKLVLEGARGCWWGQKKHCTFCGLNGSSMEFRSKRGDEMADELLDAVDRYKVLDVFMVDNIMDMDYFDSFLPKLAGQNLDLRIQYEVKSNLTTDHVRRLAAAGVAIIQPGIENLHSNVLSLMDKGVTGAQNVRLLRDCETYGLTVSWNYLIGFPGEQMTDYRSIIPRLPAIHHLQPPTDVTRIVVERFSPYFNRPELGFKNVTPRDYYALVFDLPEAELSDIAYIFHSETRGIRGAVEEDLREAIAEWRMEYSHSRFVHWDLGDRIALRSERIGIPWSDKEITDPREVRLYRLLDSPKGVDGLTRHTRGEWVAEELATVLNEWADDGILFCEGPRFVAIAGESTNSELLKVGQRAEAATR